MANNNWIGNAQPRVDEHWVVPGVVTADSYFILEINSKQVKVNAAANNSSGTATAISAAGIAELLKEAIDNSSDPEWNEIEEVVYAYLNNDGVTYTESDDPATMIVLRGPTDGKPLTITCTTSTGLAPSVLITEVTKGVTGQNEKQSVSFGTTTTGGTFTLSFAGQTTGAIAYNADAATVATALRALSNIADGADVDVTVTGSAGAWVVEFKGAYAQVNVPLMVGDGANLTGAGRVDIATTTQGNSGTGGQNVTAGPFYTDVGSYRWKWEPTVGEVQYSGYGVNAPTSGGFTNANATVFGTRYIYDPTDPHYGSTEWYVTFDILVPGRVTLQAGASSGYGSGWTDVTYPEPFDFTGIAVAVDEVQTITVYKTSGGDFTLTFEGQTTAAITYSAAPATLATNIQTALRALSNLTPDKVTVAYSSSTAATDIFTATFPSALGDVEQMTADATGLTGGMVLVTTTQSAIVNVNEVQLISLPNNPSAGTFTLSFGGETTAAIAYNAVAADVETAFEALASVGSGNVTVSGTAPNWTVTFTGTLAAADQALITGSGLALIITGTQTIELYRAKTRRYDGGTWVQSTRIFTVQSGGHPVNDGIVVGDYAQVFRTTGIGVSAYMSRVTARDATTITLSADEIEGTEPTDGTADTTLLIVIPGTGPNYWDNVDNWSLGVLPVDADALTAENCDVPILYNINQSLITPASFKLNASFQAAIGLPEWSEAGYREYRRRDLALGNAADAQTITIDIGRGEGAGCLLIRLDTGDARVTGSVYQTSTSSQTNLPTIMWKGTHASNSWRIQRGSFGAAVLANEVATIATLNIDWYDSQEQDAQVVIGSGVTLTTITKSGGSLVTYAGFTTLSQESGETVVHSGTPGTVTLRGGSYVHNTIGNYTLLTVYDAIADFSKSTQTLTGTNTTLYKDATFLDPNERIAFTNPIAIHGRVRELDLGVDYNLQRS